MEVRLFVTTTSTGEESRAAGTLARLLAVSAHVVGPDGCLPPSASCGRVDARRGSFLFLHLCFGRDDRRCALSISYSGCGAVAELVGIEGGVVSGVLNPDKAGVGAPAWRWRPRLGKSYHIDAR